MTLLVGWPTLIRVVIATAIMRLEMLMSIAIPGLAGDVIDIAVQGVMEISLLLRFHDQIGNHELEWRNPS